MDWKRYQNAKWQFTRENAIASAILIRPGSGYFLFYDPNHPSEALAICTDADRTGDFVWDECRIANGNLPESEWVWYSVGNRFGLGEAIAEWFRHNDERMIPDES